MLCYIRSIENKMTEIIITSCYIKKRKRGMWIKLLHEGLSSCSGSFNTALIHLNNYVVVHYDLLVKIILILPSAY